MKKQLSLLLCCAMMSAPAAALATSPPKPQPDAPSNFLKAIVPLSAVCGALGLTAAYEAAKDGGFLPAGEIFLPADPVAPQGEGFCGGALPVEIPSPMKEFKTVAEAETALNINITEPTLPDGYQVSSVQTISDDLLQIIYRHADGSSITFRAAQGDRDISGDYANYAVSKEVTQGQFTATLSGADGIYQCAVWSDGEMSYSLHLEQGLEEAAVLSVIGSVA